MHPFLNETTQIISVLSEASAKIEVINNPDMHWVKNKILMDLKKNIDTLKIQLGIEPDVLYTGQPKTTAPLTRIFGKDVTLGAKRFPVDVNKPVNQTPQDVAYTELQLKADELYPRFLSTLSDHLLDSVPDDEIRAVAKKAGLPVTETSPNRITVDYIDKIKAAIKQQSITSILPEEPLKNKVSASKLTPDEEKELSEIRALYADFDSQDNTSLLENVSQLHIRAVAKIAGLPVTETSPKKIDGKFIEQIKTAIKKKAEIEADGNV